MDTCNQIPPSNMAETRNAKDCLELPTHKFSYFYIKKRNLNLFD